MPLLAFYPQPGSPAGRAGLFARALIATCLLAVSAFSGCSGIGNWWRNGFRVGPDYGRPPAPIADAWIDADDAAVKTDRADYSHWWSVFDDPTLDQLVQAACAQNLSLKIAGLRIMEARAQRGIAVGNLFPQAQEVDATYTRAKYSNNMYPFGMFPGNRAFDDWAFEFNAAWEADIWGKIRRGIESADANLDAQVENYDDVLVILQGDVAASYIQMRTVEEQISLTRENIRLQRSSLGIAQRRFDAGLVGELDVHQAGAQLAVTESALPQLEEAHRRVQNALCLLVGMPPGSLQADLSEPRPIPAAPAEVVIGIPADLLRRRPDVRRAERQAAAQSARIGIAEAELYPQFALTGTIELESQQLGDLVSTDSVGGRVGPGMKWNVLNFGRIRNNVAAEDAKFQQAAVAYQNTVLAANKETEDAIVSFLREQQRVKALKRAVDEVDKALKISTRLYEEGLVDFQRVLDSQRNAVSQQDSLAQSRGKVATNLVAVYKSIGGGWMMRLPSAAPEGEALAPSSEPLTPTPAEPVPATEPVESHVSSAPR